MILLCNGDSWTQGDSPAQDINWGASQTLDWYDIIPNFGEPSIEASDRVLYKFYDSEVWPKVLGKKLGVETWNCGKLGVSIDRIVRSTIRSVEYLESLGKKDLFVVIGLTSLTRFSNIMIDLKKKKLVYEDLHLIDKRLKGVSDIDILSYQHLNNIIHIQNYLKMKNIPYLIFNAFDDGMEKDLKKIKLYDYIDLNNIYNRDFKPHFRNFISEKFNTNWTNKAGQAWLAGPNEYFVTAHPTDKSHIEWGKQLYKYIKENYDV